jgi:hypothetical protein
MKITSKIKFSIRRSEIKVRRNIPARLRVTLVLPDRTRAYDRRRDRAVVVD